MEPRTDHSLYKFLFVRWTLTGYAFLKLGPQILDRIKIWAIPWSTNHFYIAILKPGDAFLGSVARSTILLEDEWLSLA